jgi:hypothetical protein
MLRPIAFALLLTSSLMVASDPAVAQTKTEVQCNKIGQFCIYHWYSAGYASQDDCLNQTWDPYCFNPGQNDPRGDPQYGNPYADITYGCLSDHVLC